MIRGSSFFGISFFPSISRVKYPSKAPPPNPSDNPAPKPSPGPTNKCEFFPAEDSRARVSIFSRWNRSDKIAPAGRNRRSKIEWYSEGLGDAELHRLKRFYSAHPSIFLQVP